LHCEATSVDGGTPRHDLRSFRVGTPRKLRACFGAEVQRIHYAENETNYCPRCQTEDKILADRSLSRLLKDDWPRTVEELEE